MMSSFLKRIVPFLLTLMVGAALGSFASLFGSRTTDDVSAVKFTTPGTFRKKSCGMKARDTYYSSGKPIILFKPEPQYTEAARRNGVTGVVRLNVTFGADGVVSEVEEIMTLPYGLTEEAKRAARGIKFSPAVLNGQPVSMTRIVEYRFDTY
ncbi:MAG: energy transducer TonB [Pyrinomonadaceae bacterium]